MLLLVSLLALLGGCAPTAESFPHEFAREAARVYGLDDSLLRYEVDPNGTCDGPLDGYEPLSTDELEADAEALVTPCVDFDEEAAAECLSVLRSIRSCEDALSAYGDGDVGQYVDASCLDACGIVPG